MSKKVFKRTGENKVHIFVEQRPLATQATSDKKRPLEAVRDAIGLVSAGAGIFIALLYLAGRYYAAGYFEAMNIPSYLLNFSLWEYAEVAWLPALAYSVALMFLGFLFWGIVFIITDWLIKKFQSLLPNWRLSEVSLQVRVTLTLAWYAFVTICFILFVAEILQFVNDAGKFAGTSAVLERSVQVELVSATPMTLSKTTIASVQVSGKANVYYTYDGFRLLTYNGGKYYLFTEIDPYTCRPTQVYVIDGDQYKQVHLIEPTSLNDKCQQQISWLWMTIPTAGPTTIP